MTENLKSFSYSAMALYCAMRTNPLLSTLVSATDRFYVSYVPLKEAMAAVARRFKVLASTHHQWLRI